MDKCVPLKITTKRFIGLVGEKRKNATEQRRWPTITGQEIKNTLKSASNWKTPGIDKVPNFWLKHLTSTHHSLATAFHLLIGEPQPT